MSQIPSWSNQAFVMSHAGCGSVFVCLYIEGLVWGFPVFTVTYPHVGQTREPAASVVHFLLNLIFLNQEIGDVPKPGSDILKCCKHEANLEPCLERVKCELFAKLKKCWGKFTFDLILTVRLRLYLLPVDYFSLLSLRMLISLGLAVFFSPPGRGVSPVLLSTAAQPFARLTDCDLPGFCTRSAVG